MSTLFEKLQHTLEETVPAYQALVREVQSVQPQLREESSFTKVTDETYPRRYARNS